VHTDKYINMAMLYLFRKASEELKGFPSAEVLKKIGHEVDSVILSRGRIMQCMEFMETAEVDVDLGSMGIRASLPVLDRPSPLSYSIAQHVHLTTCNSAEQKLSLTKGGRGTDSTYPRYTEHAVHRLIKIFSVEKTNLAEDLAELSKKMKLLENT
jgi:hypothetical protein